MKRCIGNYRAFIKKVHGQRIKEIYLVNEIEKLSLKEMIGF
jgi:hypothetical protein